MKSFLKELLITFVMAAIITVGFRLSLQTFGIFMNSMEPNFHEGQRLLVNKIAYTFSEPSRGDVVIIHAPANQGGDFIKRLIGLPGDTIEIKKGVVYVNGKELDEPYVKNSFTYSMAKEEIPASHYFVLGDNRDISNDSHRGWLSPRSDIVGKAWIITWPPGDWGVVPDYPLDDQLTASWRSSPIVILK